VKINLSILVLIICIIVLNSSCKKGEDTYSYEYPYLVLRGISNINTKGITATAEILSLGKDSIIDFGFVWSTNGSPTIESFKLSFTDHPQIGIFLGEISNCINENTEYYIRPYIQGKKFLVYGNTLKFTGLGSLDPQIYDFFPKEGKRKSLVTITGDNFNSNPTIYFGSERAKVIKSNLIEIVVEVPPGIGDVKISLHQNDKIFESNQLYNILYPWSKISLPNEIPLLEYPTGFAINGKGYIVCGYSSITNSYSKKLWEYNPLNNEWVGKSDFPGEARENAVSFTINGKAYIGFGDNGIHSEVFSDLWEYDPASDIWSRKEDFPLQEYGIPVCFSDNYKGYIGLGLEQYSYGFGGQLSSKFWSFDPTTNLWEQLSDYPLKTFLSTAFVVNNNSFVGLGIGNNFSFYDFNPLTNSWRFKFTYPGNGDWHVKNFVIDDKVYIGFGNHDNSNEYTDFWEFNHTTNIWTKQIDFPYPTEVWVSFSINGKGYVFENKYGSTGFIRSFWRFDPEKNY
jgi:N-acetylneuraminic acid mutarotase